MKKSNWMVHVCVAACGSLFTDARPALAQGTAFTYQGQLMNAGAAANGNYDLQFALFNSLVQGSQSGSSLIVSNLPVSAGLFTTTLDFGAGVFNGSNYWLEIAVRTNGNGNFTTLCPRQSVTPAPYAIFSGNAASALEAEFAAVAASVPAGAILGIIPTTALPSNIVTNGQQGVVFNGTFSGDASGLTNIMDLTSLGIENTNGNTFLGLGCGQYVTNGQNVNFGEGNVAVGAYAEGVMVTGDCNTAVGANSQFSMLSGSHNTSLGHGALGANVSGDYNVAIGAGTLEAYLGDDNEAYGFLAMWLATGGPGNTAIGETSMENVTNGGYNTAVGQSCLSELLDGEQNIGLGSYAGWGILIGSNNIDIGNAGSNYDNATIRLGTQDTQTNTLIAGIWGATVPGGAAVYVNSSGQLGTLTSSARFKQDIHSMGDASDLLLALRPVTFRYKPELDPNGTPQFGLIAEEVNQVDPALVVRDGQNQIYTVRYEAINAMLLNEFQKEHRKVEQQQAEIQALQAKEAELGELKRHNVAMERRLDEMQKLLEAVVKQK